MRILVLLFSSLFGQVSYRLISQADFERLAIPPKELPIVPIKGLVSRPSADSGSCFLPFPLRDHTFTIGDKTFRLKSVCPHGIGGDGAYNPIGAFSVRTGEVAAFSFINTVEYIEAPPVVSFFCLNCPPKGLVSDIELDKKVHLHRGCAIWFVSSWDIYLRLVDLCKAKSYSYEMPQKLVKFLEDEKLIHQVISLAAPSSHFWTTLPTIYSVKGDDKAIILRFDGMKANEQFKGNWTKYLLLRIPESAMKENK